jgi:hypothetical protein
VNTMNNTPLTRYAISGYECEREDADTGAPIYDFPYGSPMYLAGEADQLIASLREQLACAQSEAKFAREHLEREREKVRVMQDEIRIASERYLVPYLRDIRQYECQVCSARHANQWDVPHGLSCEVGKWKALASHAGGERV